MDIDLDASSKHHHPPWRQIGSVVATCALAVAGAAACGDGDSGASPIGEETTTTEAPSTTITQPSAASDAEAAFDAVEAAVLEATGIADRLVQNPEAVNDPDNADIARLHELYTEDSATPDGLVAQLQDYAEKGQRWRPTPGGAAGREVAPYSFEAVDADTIRFDTCNQSDAQLVDADGNVVETDARIVFVAGSAKRVEGVWRLQGFESDFSRSNPIDPGSSVAGYCTAFVADDRVREVGQ